MSYQQKSTRLDDPLASDNQVWDSLKELRGLSSCQDPHIHPLFASSGQRTNGNVHSLITAKQVTMGSNLLCYRVFHCFLTPSFVLLGASAKSRYLGKLSHPSLLSRQVKTVIFISKITITTKSPILHFAPMWTNNTPHCPKKEQNYHH